MAGKVRPWVWIVAGIFAVGILFIIAAAAAGIFFVRQSLDTRKVTGETAAVEFDTVRARFKGQRALIELDERGNILRSNVDREAPHGARRPETLVVMAFDPDDGGLVRVRIPFWLLRMKMDSGVINFGNSSMSFEDLKLRVEQLDRLGPCLILDQRNAGGDRVVVWTE